MWSCITSTIPTSSSGPKPGMSATSLVTLNDDLPDNTRPVAQSRIEAIAARLARDPKRFEEQAMKHSECPSALQGGLLGEVPRGQLYPELDAALFLMQEGEVSAILESPMGLHLLRCESITPAAVLTLERSTRPHPQPAGTTPQAGVPGCLDETAAEQRLGAAVT